MTSYNVSRALVGFPEKFQIKNDYRGIVVHMGIKSPNLNYDKLQVFRDFDNKSKGGKTSISIINFFSKTP